MDRMIRFARPRCSGKQLRLEPSMLDQDVSENARIAGQKHVEDADLFNALATYLGLP